MFKKLSALIEILTQNSRKLYLLLFISAFLVRVVYIMTLEDKWYFYDTVHYDKAASSILSEQGFGKGYYFSGLTEFQDEYSLTPVYPLFLAGIYSTFGHNFFAVRIIQCLIGAFICIMIFLIGREIFNQKVGFIAAVVAVLYPLFIFISGLLYVTVLFTLFIAVFVWFTLKSSSNESIANPVLAGLFLGIATLAGPILLATYPFVVLWLLLQKEKSMIRRAKVAGILLGVAIFTLIPWSVRNYKVFGRISPVSAAVDWFLAEAQSKIQNELTIRIHSSDSGHHFALYVNGNYDSTLSDTTKAQGNGLQHYAGIVLNGRLSSDIDRFVLKRIQTDSQGALIDGSLLEFEDNFEREGLGSNWIASSHFGIADGKLKITSPSVEGDLLAVCKTFSNPSELTIKWAYTSEASGMGKTGLALLLDNPGTNANGYMIKRQPFGISELWLIENGLPGRLLAETTEAKSNKTTTNGIQQEKNAQHSDSFVSKIFHLVTDDPASFVTHYAFEFVHFWQLYPDRVSTQNRFTDWKTKIVGIISFGPILVLGLGGLIFSFSRWQKPSLIFFTIISVALGYAFFQTRVRYRIPVEPYMIIFAVYGFLMILKKLDVHNK